MSHPAHKAAQRRQARDARDQALRARAEFKAATERCAHLEQALNQVSRALTEVTKLNHPNLTDANRQGLFEALHAGAEQLRAEYVVLTVRLYGAEPAHVADERTRQEEQAAVTAITRQASTADEQIEADAQRAYGQLLAEGADPSGGLVCVAVDHEAKTATYDTATYDTANSPDGLEALRLAKQRILDEALVQEAKAGRILDESLVQAARERIANEPIVPLQEVAGPSDEELAFRYEQAGLRQEARIAEGEELGLGQDYVHSTHAFTLDYEGDGRPD